MENIKNNSIIICKEYLKPSLMKKLLDKNKALSVDIVSLDNYLNRFIVKEEDESIYKYYEKIKQLKLDKFKVTALKSSFLNEVKVFIDNLKKYDLSYEQIDDSNDYLKELKYIVSNLYAIETPIDKKLKAFKVINSFENVYIYDFNPNLFEKNIYKKMVELGAINIDKEESIPTNIEFKYCLNKKEEVEAMARYIIDNNIDLNNAKLTVLNSEYLPFVKQIFNRYNIPFYILNESHPQRIIFKYISLINYYLDPSCENLINLFDEEVFDHYYKNEFKEYINLYHKTINDDFNHLASIEISNDIISSQELKILKSLEDKAQKTKNDIYDFLHTLELKNLNDALVYIDEIIISNYNFSDLKELDALHSIRNKIRLAYNHINKENIEILLNEIKNIKTKADYINSGIVITSLKEMLDNYDYHFMIGANSDNYPAFNTLAGIFSENYVKNSDYPPLEERYELNKTNLLSNLNSSNNLYISYSVATINGKEKECSLEIEDYLNNMKPVYCNVDYSYKNFNQEEKISSETASKLYFKNNKIYGSVSSLEKYSRCPFQYFVSNGLKVDEPVDYSFNSAKSGTLMHYLFETLTNTYHKEYSKNTSEVITDLLDEKINEIIKVYPNLVDEFKVVKERVLTSVDKNLEVLDKMEEASSLDVENSEYEFRETINIKDAELDIHGFVDRINSNNDFIQIIDYKSSKHELKEKEVLECLKLQLLTYLVIVAKKFNKRVIGAYYYSFANNLINGEYAKLDRRNKILNVNEEEDYFNNFMASKKLEGWTFDKNYEVIDPNLEFIKGVNVKKDGSFGKRTNIYDLDGVEKMLIQIYETIIDSIRSGDISKNTYACVFCKFDSICHHKGKQLVENEEIKTASNIYKVCKGEEM